VQAILSNLVDRVVVMTLPAFPFPKPNPLKRLHVYDGLTINAASWCREREYHRHRQSLHYQSLHEPGIVCGLGVRILEEREIQEILPNQLQGYGRWVEVEPGVAIDVEGNPIIIPPQPRDARCFYIRDPIDELDREVMVYLYVCYHEPVPPGEDAFSTSQDALQEWFEIDQQTEVLTGKEVELCRLQLKAQQNQLYPPRDFLHPETNELDFRYRRSARVRPQKTVRVGVLENEDLDETDEDIEHAIESFQDLTIALEALYPQLYGIREIDRILFSASSTLDVEVRKTTFQNAQVLSLSRSVSDLARDYDILYLGAAWQHRSLNTLTLNLLRQYIEFGGLLWVEVPQGVSQLPILSSLEQIQRSEDRWEDLDRRHPIRTEPFAFQRLPIGEALEPIQLKKLGNIILCQGQLSLCWGASFSLELDRAEIRTAQELGINLLNFAWYYRSSRRLLDWGKRS